jgi:type II secretory pathway component PulC
MNTNISLKPIHALWLNILLSVGIIIAVALSSMSAYTTPSNQPKFFSPASLPFHHNTLSDIASWHLFGMSYTEANSNIFKTTLTLQLEGVFLSDDNESSRAIISVEGNPAKLFNIGQAIMPNVTLLKVFNNQIYISNQGKTEKLLMPLPTL